MTRLPVPEAPRPTEWNAAVVMLVPLCRLTVPPPSAIAPWPAEMVGVAVAVLLTMTLVASILPPIATSAAPTPVVELRGRLGSGC